MYEIVRSKQFKSSYKRVVKSGYFKHELFKEIFDCLQNGLELPMKFRDHPLKANFYGYRECHISGDMLLIYEIDQVNKIITYSDIGSHSKLFGL